MDYETSTRDECILERVHESSLKDIGCTSPFGHNKDEICKDQEKAAKVMELVYNEEMLNLANSCYSPCAFLSTKAIITKEGAGYGYSYATMMFKQNIKP